MNQSSLTRRTLLRVGALGSTGLVAGCQKRSERATATPESQRTLAAVPADSTFVFEIDVERLRATDGATSSLDQLLGHVEALPASLAAIDELTDDKTGLDAGDLGRLLGFGTPDRLGALAETDWSTAELQRGIEQAGGEIEQQRYRERTILSFRDDELAIGALGDGTFTVGPQPTVEDVIDVQAGTADSVGGIVRSAFEASEGLVRLGFEGPFEVGQDRTLTGDATDLQRGRGALTADGRARLVVETTTADGASAFADATDRAVERTRSQIAADDSRYADLTDTALAALDATSVATDGTTVTITNDRGFDLLFVLGGIVVTEFVLGLGDTVEESTPQADFEFAYDTETGTVDITHTGGDNVRASRLSIGGSGFRTVEDVDMTAPGTWGGTTSGTTDGEPAVVAGDTVTVGVERDYELMVVYRTENRAAVLAESQGPEV